MDAQYSTKTFGLEMAEPVGVSPKDMMNSQKI